MDLDDVLKVMRKPICVVKLLRVREVEWTEVRRVPGVGKLPAGMMLYAIPSEAVEEIERLRWEQRDKDEELDFLRAVKVSRGKELDEKEAEIVRLRELIRSTVDQGGLLSDSQFKEMEDALEPRG